MVLHSPDAAEFVASVTSCDDEQLFVSLCLHSGHSLLHILVRHLCFRSAEGEDRFTKT